MTTPHSHDSFISKRTTLDKTPDVAEPNTKGRYRKHARPSMPAPIGGSSSLPSIHTTTERWARLRDLKKSFSRKNSKKTSKLSLQEPDSSKYSDRRSSTRIRDAVTLEMDYTTDDSLRIGDKYLESGITEETEMTLTSNEESSWLGEMVPVSSYHRKTIPTIYKHKIKSVDDRETMSNYHHPEGNFAFFKYGDGMVKLINIHCRLVSIMDLVRKYLGVDQKVDIDLTTMEGEFLHLPARDPTTDMAELLVPRETYIACRVNFTQDGLLLTAEPCVGDVYRHQAWYRSLVHTVNQSKSKIESISEPSNNKTAESQNRRRSRSHSTASTYEETLKAKL